MARPARLAILERSFRQSVEAEKLTALAEFAAGAGHEINNPLAVIAGRAQLLLRDEADPERRRDLALMNTQAMRVNEMIADLRLFATPPDLERQSLDLTLLVRRVIDEMQPLAVAQDTILSLADASSAVPMEADPVQLTVALRSLCQNARRSWVIEGGSRSLSASRAAKCGSRSPTTGRASCPSSGRTSSSPSIPRGRPAAASAWGSRSVGGS